MPLLYFLLGFQFFLAFYIVPAAMGILRGCEKEGKAPNVWLAFWEWPAC